jgi:spore germination protein YaaH
MTCENGEYVYKTKPADSCYSIASQHGLTMAQFHDLNPDTYCSALLPEQVVCIGGSNIYSKNFIPSACQKELSLRLTSVFETGDSDQYEIVASRISETRSLCTL